MYSSETASTNAEESKYTAAAQLLSSFASGESSMTPSSLSFLSSGVSTGTTPTLTPTTLRSLESVLASAASEFVVATTSAGGNQLQLRESGFIPPLIDPVVSSGASSDGAMVKQEFPDWVQDESSLSEDSGDWMPPSVAKRPRVSGGDAIVVAPAYGATAGAPFPTTVVSQTPPNRRGGRRGRSDAHLSAEEIQRRNIRRERNKLAAAKCRQRRVDLTNTLINQSDKLEEEQSKLNNDIENLRQQKEQLEFLLQAHQPVCTAKVSSAVVVAPAAAVKQEEDTEAAAPVSYGTMTTAAGTTVILAPPRPPQPMVVAAVTGVLSRPSSLPISTKVSASTLSGAASITDATGVPITTPSAGLVGGAHPFTPTFTLGLDSMMDGHTGLTPITGAPSCASQVHRTSTDTASSTSDSLSSPTTLLAL